MAGLFIQSVGAYLQSPFKILCLPLHIISYHINIELITLPLLDRIIIISSCTLNYSGWLQDEFLH